MRGTPKRRSSRRTLAAWSRPPRPKAPRTSPGLDRDDPRSGRRRRQDKLAHDEEQAVKEGACEKHRAVEPRRLRIGEDAAVERAERSGARRVVARGGRRHGGPGDESSRGADRHGDDERAVPAESDVGEARDHRAEHLPGDDGKEHAADHHLPLHDRVGVAGPGEDERDQAAREDAGANARREHEGETRREGTGGEHQRQAGDADLDAAPLAEAVAERAEKGLGDRIRQRVRGVEHRGRRRRHGEVRRHRPHHLVGQAQRETLAKAQAAKTRKSGIGRFALAQP